MTTPYEELGVSKDATQDEIKKAYKKRAKQTHPDITGTDEGFKRVNGAYLILSDPDKRAHYDTTGEEKEKKQDLSIQIIMTIFEQILASDPPGHVNIIEAIHAGLMGMIKEAMEANVKFEASIKKFERQKTKFRGKKGKQLRSNIFINALDTKIRDLRIRATNAEEAIENARKAAKILKDYEYEPDSPQSMSFSEAMSTAQRSNSVFFTFR